MDSGEEEEEDDDDDDDEEKKRRRGPILRAGGRTERKNWEKKIPVGDISYLPTYTYLPT